MFAVYKRELRSFFHSMTGWLFIASVVFLTGIYFFAINLLSGYSSVANTVASSVFIYVLTIPILTMRILSEERKQKIDQLTLTSPVSVGGIVFGKYLAMATVLMIPLILVACFPLILSSFGTIAYAENYTAIAGFLLYGLAAIAMGLFISSITESQVIAAIISFAAMFATYMMSGIISLLTSNENVIMEVLTKGLEALDFSSRFDMLLNGQLNLRAVFYYITIIFVFLYLTTQSIQKRRYSVSVKNFKIGAYSAGSIVICIVAAVFANLMVNELPEKYVCFDVTSDKLYSLSEETVEFLENVEEDITIYVLQSEDSMDTVLDGTLQKFADAADGKITITYKDPVRSPTFYKSYTDGNITMNSLIVESEKRHRVIDYSDVYEYEIDYSTYSQSLTGYDGEGQLASAIDYVTGDDMPVAYMISGHDEMGMDASFQDAIEKQNITVTELNLLTVDSVPTDAEFVMILSPGSDFSEDDTDKMIDYVENDGQLIVTTSLIENSAEILPNFQKILDCFNTRIVEGTLIEADSNYYYGEPTYLLPEVMNSYLTDGVYGEKYAFMPYTQGIEVTEDDNVSATSLLQSSEHSYSKLNLSSAESYHMDEDDLAGPFDVGVYVQRTYDENTAGLFLFTSPNIFTDAADMMVANANLTIFKNCVGEFVDSEESGVVIPVKAYTAEALTISTGTAMFIGLLIIFCIPFVLLVSGFMIWYQRRKA